MKIYALTGVWDEYMVLGISLNKEAVEKALQELQKKYEETNYRYDLKLEVEEFELNNNYLVF